MPVLIRSSGQQKPRLTRTEAAAFLTAHGYPTSRARLAKFVVLGGGPAYIKYGRCAMYDQDELLEWAEARCKPSVPVRAVGS